MTTEFPNLISDKTNRRRTKTRKISTVYCCSDNPADYKNKKIHNQLLVCTLSSLITVVICLFRHIEAQPPDVILWVGSPLFSQNCLKLLLSQWRIWMPFKQIHGLPPALQQNDPSPVALLWHSYRFEFHKNLWWMFIGFSVFDKGVELVG